MFVGEAGIPQLGQEIEIEIEIRKGAPFYQSGICQVWNGQVGLRQNPQQSEPTLLLCPGLVKQWRYIDSSPQTIPAPA